VLSTTSEYGVKALAYLSNLSVDELISGRELSARSGIPSNYLAKILLILNKFGFVEASRGPGGGYKLKQPSDQIHIIDVVRAFDGTSVTPGAKCFFKHSNECSSESPCTAHNHWKPVQDAYLNFIKNTTIDMIINKKDDGNNHC